jgi:hypothetical protein
VSPLNAAAAQYHAILQRTESILGRYPGEHSATVNANGELHYAMDAIGNYKLAIAEYAAEIEAFKAR